MLSHLAYTIIPTEFRHMLVLRTLNYLRSILINLTPIVWHTLTKSLTFMVQVIVPIRERLKGYNIESTPTSVPQRRGGSVLTGGYCFCDPYVAREVFMQGVSIVRPAHCHYYWPSDVYGGEEYEEASCP